MRRTHSGFTTVELIVVLVLLGILAAYAAPKFAGRGGYTELTARQDLKQSIRYAQQLAMGRTDHTIKLVTVTNTTPHKIDVLQDDVSIGGNVGDIYPKSMASDISLGTVSNGINSPGSATTLTFNRLGATTDATISVTGPQQQLNVCVVGSTGYAYDC